ncbi:MAG: hypothetical protein JWO67_3216, partial [Streptosporangiaceae bacterium]|nr:hypothetical protein [Streptosporangiaceae bacterium]
LKSYLLTPEVPDSVLVAEATRGNFVAALPELREKDSLYSFRTSAEAVFLGMVVDAVVNGEEAVERLHEAGEKEVAREPGRVWNLVHYTNYLLTTDDQRVPVLLDRIVELSHDDDDNHYLWEMHEGHIDAFHGRCDVGLRLAVVQVLCAAGRTVSAAAEAGRLRESNPTEYVRALSYVYAAEADEARAERVLEAAQQAAGTEQGGLAAQAMLVLLDGDHDRLLTAVAAKLARERGDVRLGSTTWSLLAWAAHLRGDRELAEDRGRRAVTQFSALAEDERSPSTRERLVRNLLRAGLPGAAAAVSAATTTHWGSRVLCLPVDVQHSLIMSAEIEHLTALRQALGETPEPVVGPKLETQAVAIRYLRATGDSDELARVQGAARAELHRALANGIEEVRKHRSEYYDSHDDEADAARLALLAADVGDADAVERAFQLGRAWAHQAEIASEGWDAFRGHFPRGDELKRESDNEYRRLSHLRVHLAEAYHRAGDPDRARSAFSRAHEYALQVRTAQSRSLAFIQLAEVAARCGWFTDLGEMWPELTRVRGSELCSVAEILVVTARNRGADAANARKAFCVILLDKSLVNVDYVDILALLAVLTSNPDVETRLLAAATEP